MALLLTASDAKAEDRTDSEKQQRSPSAQPAQRPALKGHLPALDGLRAVAVIAVVAFHYGAGVVRGGLLGVDIFFVLSGFLITSLLIDEHVRRGTIVLREFWGRRVRRLLPALLVMIVAVTVSARWLQNQADLRLLRDDAFSTLGYVANWHFAASGQDYFSQLAADSPLLHTWSLGIEEQFYLVWPLIALLVLRFRGGERWLRLVAILGAAASTAWLIHLALEGANTSRLYYGTDTRVAALLVGAAIATLRPGRLATPRPAPAQAPFGVPDGLPAPRRSRQWLRGTVSVLGLVGAVVLVVAMLEVHGEDPVLYRGGFLVVALAAGAVVAAAVGLPKSLLARGLSFAPLRLLGRISYGVYLWHWPVQLAVTRTRVGVDGPALFGIRVGITLVLAGVSYVVIEQPVRRRTWVTWPRRSAGLVAVAATLVAVLAGTSLAVPGQQSESPSLTESRIGTSGRIPTASPASAKIPEPAVPTRALTAAGGAPRASLGRPTRILLAGDSIAATLGWNLGPLLGQTGTDVYLDAPLGCGIVLGKHKDRGHVIADPAECPGWAQRWTSEVQSYSPDVVAILVGRWEMTDRYYAGAWRHLGDPVFDNYVRSQLERAVKIGASWGAQVALLNPPCLADQERPDGGTWPQDDPARASRFFELQQEVAARHPNNVQLLDLSGLICPGGQFARTIDGVQVRDRDGVHFTISGARWVGRSLLPALRTIAEEAHFRSVLGRIAKERSSANTRY
jgi:peptidoglycan/LPS O-acetylase OafA/YrhL